PTSNPNPKATVKPKPKVVKPKPAPPKSKPSTVKPKSKVVKAKPKHAPVKPKPAVKQSVGKRKRSVDEVVSDVLNDLSVASKEVEDDELGFDENVESDERDNGDSNEEDEEYKAEESEEESNKDKESNKDEESDHELLKNLKTKTVKGKSTKGKKKDVASESDENEMANKLGKKMNVVRKSKKRKHVSESDSLSSEDKNVLKVEKYLKKNNKQVSDSSSSFEDEKPIKKKKKLDAKKKKKKPLTAAQIKKEEYLSGFPVLHSRTVPCSLFAAIHDSQVDMKSFLSDVGFSSLHNVFIDTLPSRLARFVVTTFNGSSYEFKLEKGVIRVTPEKVHKILGVPLGGTSIFDLHERPLDDDFVKFWFKQFDPKPLKDIVRLSF
ncbi:hypothetical protein Tco_0957190, partial [Tanacetum coccineum]